MSKKLFLFKKEGFTLIEVIISLGVFGLIVGGVLSLLPWGVGNVNKLSDRNTAMGLVDAVQIELERLGFSVVEHGTKRLNSLYDQSRAPEDVVGGEIFDLILVAPRSGEIVSLERVVRRKQMRTNNKLVKESLPLGSALLDARSVNTDWGGVIEFDRSGNNPISLNGFEDQDFSSSPRNRWINAEDRYFAIICSQFAMNPYNLTDPPSRHHHHPSNGYLALQVEVQWPYKVFDPSSSESFREVHERYRSKISFPVAITR